MDIQDKTKEELISKLKELLHESDSFKALIEKREAEFLVARDKLLSQNEEKEKRAAELVIANKELAFQNKEKEKRAAELIIANKELAFQNEEKEKRAAELVIANKELLFQNQLKEKRAEELIIANEELVIQSGLKEKRAAELIIANKELAFQNEEKIKRAAELVIANKELLFQNQLKEKRAEELIIANEELVIQSGLKEKRAAELIIANKELAFQNEEKEKRAAELVIANKELAFQNEEKIKRAAELYLAKEIAEEFENKFTQIAENIDDVLWLRTSSEMIYVSPSFEKIWGVPVDESYKKPELLTEKIHPDDKPVVQEIIKSKEFEDENLFNYQFRIIQPNNQVHWIASKTFPILNDSGRIIRRAGIARDITERYHNLQELVNAMEKAEQSDRLKSAFLANMSHEIRTPMNGILGFAELLKEPNLTGEEQQEYIRIIEKSGERMLNIINNIVSISKIESNQMCVNISESNINKQIEYIYTFFKPEVESKGMKLLFKSPLPLSQAIIKTDREKLFAILTNLVKNAIKYSEKGSIEIDCNKKGEYLEFYVKDSGIGIDSSRQKAIFERFIQADISDKQAYQGAGLGLSISKAYVEMLGGKLWVESEKGIGSTFYFTVPYTTKPKETDENTIETTKGVMDNEIENLKILIVEDDETSELLISNVLKKMSREILKASNGFEAIKLCRNNPDIDLILMDIKMPVMDGYESTQQIRQFNKDVIIIAQTACGLTGDRENAIAAGCNAYISKPIIKVELLTLIKTYFKK
jgi:PAS domain S-box-containing protein